jgi:AcrR family transcriptional regulator
MDTRISDESPDKTRQRLLDAAGEIFAEKGLRGATVREICARAGANIAAVNYHFGDKQRLYSEVLRFAHACALDKYPAHAGLGPDAPAEKRLRAFVHSFLMRLLDEGRPAWHGKLMSREMAEPSEALNVIVDEQIKPNFLFLAGTVRDLLGFDAPPQMIRACANSIVGQCLFYHFGRPVMERLSHTKLSVDDVERLTDHIARFSLAGLKSIAKGAKR